MSGRADHEHAASVNAGYARASAVPEWTPTLVFYTGVQLAEAALAAYGIHEREHGDRQAAIESKWPGAGTPYQKLKQLSSNWRYLGLTPSERDVKRAWTWLDELASRIDEKVP